MLQCLENNISLLTIFDYEWINNSDMIKNIVLTKLKNLSDVDINKLWDCRQSLFKFNIL